MTSTSWYITQIKAMGVSIQSGYYPPTTRRNHYIKLEKGDWKYELSQDGLSEDDNIAMIQIGAMFDLAYDICRENTGG